MNKSETYSTPVYVEAVPLSAEEAPPPYIDHDPAGNLHAAQQFHHPNHPHQLQHQHQPQYISQPQQYSQQQQFYVQPQFQPQSIVHITRSEPNGTLRVEYLEEGCCAECWACCICCWSLPQPQPHSGKKYCIEIDGKELGKLEQGQSSTWSLSAGTHTVNLKHTGISGMFRKVVGTDCALSTSITIRSEVTSHYEIGYKLAKCANKHGEILFFDEDTKKNT